MGGGARLRIAPSQPASKNSASVRMLVVSESYQNHKNGSVNNQMMEVGRAGRNLFGVCDLLMRPNSWT
jgi:hypothetical protein